MMFSWVLFEPKKGHNSWLTLPEDVTYYFAITKEPYDKTTFD